MAVLDDIAGRRILAPSSVRWNFKTRLVSLVYEIKDKIIECCTKLEESNNNETVYKATGIKRMLNDPEFIFWLNFFKKIMPHVDMLYNQFQKRTIDAVWAKSCLKSFNDYIQKTRDGCDTLVVPPELTKRSFNIDTLRIAAKEVCDVIMLQCTERFSFTKHLQASNLLCVENFPLYIDSFPKEHLEEAVAAYPCLEKAALETELSVLYEREDLMGKKDSLITMLQRLI